LEFVQKGTNFAFVASAEADPTRYAEQPMPQDQNTNWGSLAGVGLQIGVGVGLGCVVGWWLDKRYGWSPWGVIVGAMLGLASGKYLKNKATLKNHD
jgi:F0F1-type ATP synthase assembly protein I